MLADYFTKPLQGHLFQAFHNAIMDIQDAHPVEQQNDHRSVLEHKCMNRQGAITPWSPNRVAADPESRLGDYSEATCEYAADNHFLL